MYRIVFLIMGVVLLSLASTLSKSVAFYYIGAISIGIIILATLIINQVNFSKKTAKVSYDFLSG